MCFCYFYVYVIALARGFRREKQYLVALGSSLEHTRIVLALPLTDNAVGLAEAFGVISIPMLAVMKNGEVVKQSSGARPKAQILALLEG